MIFSILPPLFIFLFILVHSRTYTQPPLPIPTLPIFACAGIVAMGLALILEIIIIPFLESLPLLQNLPSPFTPAIKAYLGISLPEETAKLTALILVWRRLKTPLKPTTSIYFGIAVALGFAFVENILVITGTSQHTPNSVFRIYTTIAILRLYTAFPLHILTGRILGLALSRHIKNPSKSITPFFLLTVLLHGTYNWILTEPRIPNLLIFAIIVPGWVITLIIIYKKRQATR